MVWARPYRKGSKSRPGQMIAYQIANTVPFDILAFYTEFSVHSAMVILHPKLSVNTAQATNFGHYLPFLILVDKV